MKTSKKAKRRLFLASIIFLAVLSFIGVTVFKYWNLILENRNQEESLTTKYEELLSNEELLKKQVSKLEDPDYVAKYARDKFSLTQEDETIIQFEE